MLIATPARIALTASSTSSASARRSSPADGATLGPANGPHPSAFSSAAEEPIAAVGLEPGNADAGRQRENLQNVSRSGIDSPEVALVILPGAVPEVSVHPGHPGDEALRLDRAQDGARVGIHLMDLPGPILPHPERALGPREPRVGAAAGRRDRGEDTAGLRIDLVDAIFGDLEQVPAVEGRARVRDPL